MQSREQQLNKALEAMHLGFRAMVQKPDQRLARLGYSRIHHRILYFVGRNNSCSINGLLKILGVIFQQVSKFTYRPQSERPIATPYVVYSR